MGEHNNTLPSQFEQERSRASLEIPLAMLAGSAAGGATGLLGVAPYHAIASRFEQRRMDQLREKTKNEQAVWKTLHELHTGKRKWSDLPNDARSELEKLYQQKKQTLNNPREMFQILNRKGPAEVIRPAQFKKLPLWRELLPSERTLRHPFKTMLTHPVPISLAMLGGLIGEYQASKAHDQRMADILLNHQNNG